jgi:hypothetical protein
MNNPDWMEKLTKLLVILGGLVTFAEQVLTLFSMLHK